MTGFAKGSYTHNYKYLEIPFWNIQFIIYQECTEQFVCISPLIYSNPRPFSGWTLQWKANWNAYSSFHKVVNTTSSPIQVEGGGSCAKSAWRDVNFLILKNYIFNLGCFQFHISQNVATSMPSLTSQSYSDSLLAVCLAGQFGAIYRPPEHPQMPDRPVNEVSVKVHRWSFGNGISMNC